MTKQKKILNIRELAEKIGMSERTLHYWLKHNKCPVQPIPGSKPSKWLTADVDKFLAGRGDA